MIWLGATLICGGFFGLGIFFTRCYDDYRAYKSQKAYDDYMVGR